MKRKGILLLVATLVLALIPAGGALAGTITLDLLNQNADVCVVDCPTDDPNGYWHFVITPNDNDSVFVTFHLNLGDITYDTGTFVLNGSQLDNVFVAVPTGYTVNSLVALGSTADVTFSGDAPSKFVLSHVCVPTPEPSMLLLLGSGLLGLGLMRRRS